MVRLAVRPRRGQQSDALTGTGLLNVAVDDLEAFLAALRERGLKPGEITDANKGVRLSALTDPDGNTVTFIGGFRVRY